MEEQLQIEWDIFYVEVGIETIYIILQICEITLKKNPDPEQSKKIFTGYLGIKIVPVLVEQICEP